MVSKEILQSTVRDESDGSYWLITTPERYHRDIEPGANRSFVQPNGAPFGADSEVTVVISAAGEFVRCGEADEFQRHFEA